MTRGTLFLGGYTTGLVVAICIAAAVSCGAAPAQSTPPAVLPAPDGTHVESRVQAAQPADPREVSPCGMFPVWLRNPAIAGQVRYGDSLFVIIPDCDGKVQRWIREQVVREQRPWLRQGATRDTVQLS